MPRRLAVGPMVVSTTRRASTTSTTRRSVTAIRCRPTSGTSHLTPVTVRMRCRAVTRRTVTTRRARSRTRRGRWSRSSSSSCRRRSGHVQPEHRWTTFDNDGAGFGDNQDTGFHAVAPGSTAVGETDHGRTKMSSDVNDPRATRRRAPKKSNAARILHTRLRMAIVATCMFTNQCKPSSIDVTKTPIRARSTSRVGRSKYTVYGREHPAGRQGHADGVELRGLR